MATWPSGISTVTLFVEDLAAAKEFYGRVFGLPVVFEDPDSAVFRFGAMLVNLLKTSAAGELTVPPPVASPMPVRGSSSRSMSTMSTRCARTWRRAA